MSDCTMHGVVCALRDIYRDDGVAVWLGAVHKSGPFKGQRPIDVCKTAEGRVRVIEWAEGQ